jgi:subtilisin family serine protease
MARAHAVDSIDASVKEALPIPGVKLLKVDEGMTVEHAVAQLEDEAAVEYAEPNFIYRAQATTPNDTHYPVQWGLNNTGQTGGTPDADIDAPEAWDITKGNPSVVVAVADTGVAMNNPDLAGALWTNTSEIPNNGLDDEGNGYVDDVRGWDFVTNDKDPTDMHLHGTHVAGTIAGKGNNAAGITGVAWQGTIMPVRVLDANGAGTLANIATGFEYARENGADIVNASFGGPQSSQTLLDVMEASIEDSPDILFVVAAGNGGTDGVGDDNDAAPVYPCNFDLDNLICVAATDHKDQYGSFSNWGAGSVDLAAPGVSIFNSLPVWNAPLFVENFETPFAPRWTQSGSPMTWATQNVAPSPLFNMLQDSPSGATYPPNANAIITKNASFSLSGATACAIGFYASFQLEPGADFLRIDIKSTGSFVEQARLTGANLPTIQPFAFDVLPGSVGSATTSLQFRLTSNPSIQGDGVYLDEIYVRCSAPPAAYNNTNGYGFLNGTSMAAPHVSGAAALMYSVNPQATVEEVKEAILNNVDPLPSQTSSKPTVTDGRLNLFRAVQAIIPKCPGYESNPLPQIVGGQVGETLTGTINAEIICGLGGDDTIFGLGGNDILVGGDGNDTIDAGDGTDQLKGEDGNDYMNGGALADAIDGGVGNDTASYIGSPAGIEANLMTGQGFGGWAAGDTLAGLENLTAANGAANDRLIGDAGPNILLGLNGRDSIYGNAGNDVLSGDAGDDGLRPGAGADVLNPGSGTDTLDYLDAPSKVIADIGTPFHFAGAAAGDSVVVGVFEDILGSTHNDDLTGNNLANVIRGIHGDDKLYGDPGNDTLLGGNQNDKLFGEGGSDKLYGENNQDRLDGGPNDDYLNGGASNDKLKGGTGTDTCIGPFPPDTKDPSCP